MDLFGDWIATKNGMLDTLLAMIESGKIAHARRRPSCSRPSTVELSDRELSWDGCANARDLGRLGRIRPGAVIRME